jgi:hypothetical protein
VLVSWGLWTAIASTGVVGAAETLAKKDVADNPSNVRVIG